ncbi:MAG TPA: ABC transporter permease, partial [Nevskiaceae bacterium]|nr:ABC transporter permease [Nevskiaceae bacterium]
MNGALLVVQNFLLGLGRSQFFLLGMLGAVPSAFARPRLVVQQLYHVGVLSLVIVVLSGSFVGMVLALQGYRTL